MLRLGVAFLFEQQQCRGRVFHRASQTKPGVERNMPHGFRWEIAQVHGDQAEAQNGLGNWMRVTYSCTVNIDTKTVTDASLDNGRLN